MRSLGERAGKTHPTKPQSGTKRWQSCYACVWASEVTEVSATALTTALNTALEEQGIPPAVTESAIALAGTISEFSVSR